MAGIALVALLASTGCVVNGTWTPQPVAGTARTRAKVTCPTATMCMAITDNDGPTLGIEVWDGSTWSPIAVPARTYGPAAELACWSATGCMLIASTSLTTPATSPRLVATWDGSSWTVRSELADPWLSQLTCAPDGSCLAAEGVGYTDNVWHAWDGDSWSLVEALGQYAEGPAHCTAAGDCVVLHHGDGTGEFPDEFDSHLHMVDGVVTKVYAPTSVSDFDCVSTTMCVATGPNGRMSVYDGTAWVVRPLPAGSSYTRNLQVSCAHAGACVVVGERSATWPATWTPFTATFYGGDSWAISETAPMLAVDIDCAPGSRMCMAIGKPGTTPSAAVYRWEASG